MLTPLRVVTGLLVVLSATGCKEKPPPPPPPSLVAAIAAVDDAVRTRGDVAGTCEKLNLELSAFSAQPRAPMAQADLSSLAKEVAVYGATSSDLGAGATPNTSQWATLKLKLERVLAGKSPTEAPRYQVGMPQEVRAAMENVDAAIARGDAAQASKALRELACPLLAWSEKLPGMRGVRVHEVVETDLMRFSMDPGASKDLGKLTAFWNATRAKLTFEQ